MIFKNIHSVYLIGVGGIGMSALARYFNDRGKVVSGYDKTSTVLSRQLESEGIKIHYEDLGPKVVLGMDVETTLVIYTPAIPKKHGELNAFWDEEFMVVKRAKALGMITQSYETFAVAGTHGKTTTSSILMHLLNETEDGCNAFIGGISTNYNSNCIINTNSKKMVVEADEFDRSFMQLMPDHAIITSMDADHLDIYGDGSQMTEAFVDFAKLIRNGGSLFVNHPLGPVLADAGLDYTTYAFEDKAADWVGTNISFQEGRFYFDVANGSQEWKEVEFGLPGTHNAENALAVFALCMSVGVSESTIRQAFRTYSGVKRRFEYKIRNDELVYIDDYAHHPTEIEAFLSSVRQLYPTKKITAIFQPHLFSRTRDFMEGFAQSLALADELFLLDIYPAREQPIEGVTSEVLLDKVAIERKSLTSLTTVVDDLKKGDHEVILTIGAGDIDTVVASITKTFQL